MKRCWKFYWVPLLAPFETSKNLRNLNYFLEKLWMHPFFKEFGLHIGRWSCSSRSRYSNISEPDQCNCWTFWKLKFLPPSQSFEKKNIPIWFLRFFEFLKEKKSNQQLIWKNIFFKKRKIEQCAPLEIRKSNFKWNIPYFFRENPTK